MTDDHDLSRSDRFRSDLDGPDRDALRRLRPDVPLRTPIELEPARGRLLDAIGHRPSARDRARRWALPAVASLATAAAAVTVIVVATGTDHRGGPPAGNPNAPASATTVSTASPSSPVPATPVSGPVITTESAPASTQTSTIPDPAAGTILNDAATRLAAQSDFATPDPSAFFYRRTTQATYWTSVSGQKPGRIDDLQTGTMEIPGCVNGQVVASGGAGSCPAAADTPHYLADAPTTAAAWGPYLLAFAPGARQNNAEGKIITSVFHDFLAQPRALAALLRYTAQSCPGLHTFPVTALDGETLIGVTCASMTHGSNALAFDATTHAWVGTVPVDYAGPGVQEGAAELVRATGFVSALGQRP